MVMQQRDAEAVPQALLYAIRLPGNSPSGQHCGGHSPDAHGILLCVCYFTVSFYTIVVYYVHFFALSVGNMDI